MSSTRQQSVRRGFTLMEMMISIGLVTVLMAGLYSAMDFCFNLQLDSHDGIERVQIARTVLRQMTRDVQSVVFKKPEKTEESSDTSQDQSTEDEDTSGTSEPVDSMTQSTDGLVGTETELLLYINRPDRSLNYVDAQTLTSLADRSGDLMVVRYFLAQKGGAGLSSKIADRESPGSDSGPAGLVRMTGDLYGISMSLQENEEDAQIAAAQLWAREVAGITFQYFDGTQWQTEWDSKKLSSLPQAIEIVLTLRTAPADDPEEKKAAENDLYKLGETTHRMVVHLPVAPPFVAETAQ